MRKQIPIYQGDSYVNSYLKESDKSKEENTFLSLQHFDFHYKCEWKNVIPVHRLGFYMVVLVMEGEGILSIGARDYYVAKNMLCFVPPGVITSWQTELEAHRGFFCTFSEDFFNLGRTDKQYLVTLPYFQAGDNAVIKLSEQDMEYFVTLFRLIEVEARDRSKSTHPIIRSHIQTLLAKASFISGTRKNDQPKFNHRGLKLLQDFTALYLKDFKVLEDNKVVKLKKVSEYANELGVAQNHLNDTVKTITGKSAGQLIRQQLVSYATACLKNSNETIAEIAYRFGFEDPSYFARFYKSQTGTSPSEILKSVESTS
ncbi:AraC family transcriptional regulator [Chryseosolibacter indicus]|uniref:Helix-turn-helix domain-containing protein n=1 Tax=Chryseosolibacter indicus TaxID=2782351 RepID=A0ABS5VRF8_9BACT|nr:helix-turn-helix transcriptional regulator [Chryseosolibacter indicus]MBT1704034.1 helix-turn-helix domain-containing protein [Chryseosolibacter indicus]